MVILNHGAGMSTSPLEGLVIIIMLLQFFVGIAELVTALIITGIALAQKKPMRGLRIYWLLVLIYFIGLAVFGFLASAFREFPEEIAFAWFFLAWGIAIYLPFYKRFDRQPQSGNNQLNNGGIRPQQHTNNN